MSVQKLKYLPNGDQESLYCYTFCMSFEQFPHLESNQPERKQRPITGRKAGSRAMRAIQSATLATSLAMNSPDIEAKGRAGYSLVGREDRGMRKEIDAAEYFGLKNFKSEEQIERALEDGILVELNPGDEDGYEIDTGLGENARPEVRHLYRCVMPYTKAFLESVARDFEFKFGKKLLISSAIRTEKYQDLLRRGNANAARGYTSSHLKGTTIDIMYYARQKSTRPEEYQMNPIEQQWMDARLLLAEMDGKIQATKEKGQPVYHVMVFPERLEND